MKTRSDQKTRSCRELVHGDALGHDRVHWRGHYCAYLCLGLLGELGIYQFALVPQPKVGLGRTRSEPGRCVAGGKSLNSLTVVSVVPWTEWTG